MNTYLVDMNFKLPTIYYNDGKPNLFTDHINVSLSGLKDQLDQIKGRLNYIDTIRACSLHLDEALN